MINFNHLLTKQGVPKNQIAKFLKLDNWNTIDDELLRYEKILIEIDNILRYIGLSLEKVFGELFKNAFLNKNKNTVGSVRGSSNIVNSPYSNLTQEIKYLNDIISAKNDIVIEKERFIITLLNNIKTESQEKNKTKGITLEQLATTLPEYTITDLNSLFPNISEERAISGDNITIMGSHNNTEYPGVIIKLVESGVEKDKAIIDLTIQNHRLIEMLSIGGEKLSKMVELVDSVSFRHQKDIDKNN